MNALSDPLTIIARKSLNETTATAQLPINQDGAQLETRAKHEPTLEAVTRNDALSLLAYHYDYSGRSVFIE